MLNKNRFLKVMAAIAIAAGMAFGQSGTTGPLNWSISDGTLTISGSGTMPDYSYATPWYSYRSSITKAIIGGSVTSIGNSAFSGYYDLTEVTIPSSVTSIGSYAFHNCYGLTGALTIPSSVTSIGERAFYGCSGLTEVNFNATNCTTMGSYYNSVFSGCNNLTTVNIGNNVTRIPDYAFDGCSGLTSVTIPSSVTSIGERAFSGCYDLTEVNFNATCTTMGSSLYPVFSNCIITTVNIGNNVTRIPDYAFSGCRGLTEVTIGSSVTSIGDYAFDGCSGLTEVMIPSSVTSIGNYAFSGCRGLTGALTIPSSVTSIGSYAFYYCSGLTEVTILSSVTSISSYAFYGCSGLTEVTIPSSVTSIGYAAFYDCSGLTEVTIPSSVTSISSYAFSGCRGLTEVTIPSSVTSIGYAAFSGCRGLTEVNFNATNCTTMGNSLYPVFYNCNSLTTLNIGNNVTRIPDCAFYGCSGLTGALTIPSSVTSIGNSAFFDCRRLTAINVEESNNNYTSIDGVLFNKAKTTLIQYPAGKTGTTYTIPSSVTSIGEHAFYYCNGLTSVTIPSSVTSIGERAFYYCNGLTKIINQAETPQKINFNVFYNFTPIKLFVSFQAFDKYKTDVIWGKFSVVLFMLDKTNINLAKDETQTLEAMFVEGYPDDKTVIWTSDNTDVVTVNTDGTITAKKVGTATVTATAQDTAFDICIVTVVKGTPQYSTPTNLTATYGQSLADVKLPTGFSWEKAGTVGNVGIQTHKAKFTPTDIANYNVVENIEVSVNVAKAKITKPAVTNTNLVYIGSEQTAGIATNTTYTVTGDKGTTANNYNATIVLTDKANCEWADGTTDDIVLTWTITKAMPSEIVFPTTSDIIYTPNKLLSQIAFVGGSGDGIFAWENASIVPTANNDGYNVVFTPRDADNYDYTGINLTKTVDLSVAKATGTFVTPAAVNVTYSSNLKLEDLTLPEGFAFVTSTTLLNAGNNQPFAASFTDPSGNYTTVSGSITVNVAKAMPSVPNAVSVTYSPTLKLSDLDLPEGYAWDTPNTALSAGNNQRFVATFFDWSGNYTTASGYVTVNVAKAEGTFTTPAAVNTTYSPTLKLSDVSLPNGYAFVLPTTALSAGNSQSFAAIYTDPSGNYESATGNITVNVAKAMLSPTAPNGLTATVGQTLKDVSLEDGWSWMNETLSVGALGEQVHLAKFTPEDTENYNIVENIDVKVVVSASTPIEIKPNDTRSGGGIRLSSNIVSDKAVITIDLPNNERASQIKVVVYDNTGNSVFETTERNAKVEWHLTNAAGRNVANGT
ncbi:MAG: leucine-rich repeat protein, partial [Chitinispirillales bacterium]|nr:leucine-rich repeat protein [Chitinispirillales bacterium]